MKPTCALPKLSQCLATSVFALALSCSLQAQTYSFVDDFQFSPNGTNTSLGIWQYFEGVDATRDGSYTLLPFFDTIVQGTNFQAWAHGNDAVPYVGVVPSGGPAFFGVPAGSGYVHPEAGVNGGLAIGFRAPTTGLFDVSFSLYNADGTAGDGVDWYLDKNSAAGNLAFGSATQAHEVDTASISSLALDAGDFIFLVVNANDLNSYNNTSDSTAVSFTVTQVPEPSTFVLVGAGLAGATFFRRRPRVGKSL